MALNNLPVWLDGKVKNYDVTLALHRSADVDQVGAVFFMRPFLAGLGLNVKLHFGEPFPEGALPLDLGGGLFDGHGNGLSATFLAAKLTGFLGKHPWVEPVVRDVGQLDASERYQGQYLADLRTLSRLLGYTYREAQCDPRQDPERKALEFGLTVFEKIVFEARTRDNALDFLKRQGEKALRVIEVTGQGKVVVIQAPIWAQPAIADYARRQHNQRLLVSLAVPNRESLSILSRKNELDLTPIALALRTAELMKRGQHYDGDLTVTGKVAGWFMPEGHWLVCCGTPKHPVIGDDVTSLTVDEVTEVVIGNLDRCMRRTEDK